MNCQLKIPPSFLCFVKSPKKNVIQWLHVESNQIIFLNQEKSKNNYKKIKGVFVGTDTHP